MNLPPRTAALKAKLDAMPGAVAEMAYTRARAPTPLVVGYKLLGKTFAILSVRADEWVVLKCDPHLIEILKEQYAGVGHRTHLDRRHWIAVKLDADVPPKEIDRLAAASYDLVRANLTRKEQAALAAALRT